MSAGNLDPKVLGNLSPSVLATLPAGQPPPGIPPNFENPVSLVPVLILVGVVSFFLAFFSLLIRLYTKIGHEKQEMG